MFRMIIVVLLSVLLVSCSSVEVLPTLGNVELNPYGNSPLTAEIELNSDRDLMINIIVLGKEEGDLDFNNSIYYSHDSFGNFSIPILGLYPDYNNEVVLELMDSDQNVIKSEKLEIFTDPLPEYFPNAETVVDTNSKDMVFVLWLYKSYISENRSLVGIVYDLNGNVRWYSDFDENKTMPMEIINNDIFYSDAKDMLIQSDFLGRKINQWNFSKHGYKDVHHDIIIKPNGNFLLTIDKNNQEIIEDYVVEYDSVRDEIIKEWDLKDVLPNVDNLFPRIKGSNQKTDPIHVNGVFYDPRDNTIIVSSQRSGIAKITDSEELKWFLTFHKVKYPDGELNRRPINLNNTETDWDYSKYLLSPLNNDNTLIMNQDVLDGNLNYDEFEWPFKPHKPIILKNGNLLLFDNGMMRNFKWNSENAYSRAVEYEIVEEENGGTIKQVWEYKLNEDPKWPSDDLSILVGDVDELDNGNRLITFGAIGSIFVENFTSFRGAKIVEIDPITNKEIFILNLSRKISSNFPNLEFSVYRSEKVNLYAGFNEKDN